MKKLFSRKKEDFVCEKCGFFKEGDGFTDHCPVCIWSKHVDINPGDRMSACGGMMEPVGVKKKERDILFTTSAWFVNTNTALKKVLKTNLKRLLS